MTYELAIGDRMFSSWSLRGWLMFEGFDLHVNVSHAFMKTPDFGRMLEGFPPARLVPAARLDGDVVWESLAIAETLAERNPDAGLWPADPSDRATARALVAEMHAGFTALRGACPMDLRSSYAGFEVSDAVRADLDRLETLWSLPGRDGWLFGSYSLADVFYAPVATRIATYRLPVGPSARAYVDRHLAHGPFRRWRAMAHAAFRPQPQYDNDRPTAPWPGPTPRPATAATDVTPINQTCPFSGDPVVADSLALIDGTPVGFCNRFCRDKAVADPEAWPKLVALLQAG